MREGAKKGLMNRRAFLKAIGSAALLPILPRRLLASTNFRRRRPSDAAWPSQSAWKRLDDAVGGNLIPVTFPLSVFKTDPSGTAAKLLSENLRNPYYIGDQPGLTQTLGWVDAWATKPSVYAVAAKNAHDIAKAVNFARENDLRLVVKGGGHSYQGTSNAPDSLLIWTRHMNDIAMHTAFVPQGCEHTLQPQPAVTVGAGTIGMQAYDAVTTKGGKYVQGGGCTTVCLGGLIQGGGFGSHSKHYGTAAGSLLEAEVVTADGEIRVANACTNPDLFWALKGGGGGTFGVVSKMTLRLHDLPEFFGGANFTIKAASDDAYRRLIREFVSFYQEHLFNGHWGEQAQVDFDNRPGAGPNDAWWKGDGGQVGWFIGGYESLWLPASLLESDAQQRLADALFASSRYSGVGLHFNKGLAGAPPDALAAAKDTAMNPAVLSAFALAIVADGQGPAYPGIPGYEPSVVAGRKAAERVDRCMSQLRALVPDPGSYVSESNYFENGWQHSYWGSNYPRLAEIKRKYDPDGLFFVHNGVGSEQWSGRLHEAM